MALRVFVGDDTYRSHFAYLSACEEERKKNSLVILRDEELTDENLSSRLQGQTLFGKSPALAIERIAETTGKRADTFVEILANNSSDQEIIFWEASKPESRLKVWKFLQKNAEIKNFSSLSQNEIFKWVNDKVSEAGGKISDVAIWTLIKNCGRDLWVYSSEIEKLVMYAKDREITPSDIYSITPISSEINVFTVVRALATGEGSQALKNLVAARKNGEDSRFILTQVTREVRALLGIRDLLDRRGSVKPFELGTKLGVRDFVIEALIPAAKKTSSIKLKRLFDQLVVSLHALNTGKAEEDDLLDSIAFQSLKV